MTHVPYKGAGPRWLTLDSGHIQVTFETLAPRCRDQAGCSAARGYLVERVPEFA